MKNPSPARSETSGEQEPCRFTGFARLSCIEGGQVREELQAKFMMNSMSRSTNSFCTRDGQYSPDSWFHQLRPQPHLCCFLGHLSLGQNLLCDFTQEVWWKNSSSISQQRNKGKLKKNNITFLQQRDRWKCNLFVVKLWGLFTTIRTTAGQPQNLLQICFLH